MTRKQLSTATHNKLNKHYTNETTKRQISESQPTANIDYSINNDNVVAELSFLPHGTMKVETHHSSQGSHIDTFNLLYLKPEANISG